MVSRREVDLQVHGLFLFNLTLDVQTEDCVVHIFAFPVCFYRPDLTLTLAGKSTKKVDAGEKVRVKVTFQLPDDVDQLTGCYLRFEGSALDGSLEYAVP